MLEEAETATETEPLSTEVENVTDIADAEPQASPAERLAQLTAELNALHNAQLLVSPHVDKKQIAGGDC